MAWYDLLLPASWRGVPFGVRGSEYGGGRRTAVHSYPMRDGAWVEDLGQYERRVAFSGFIVGDGCYARAKLLLRACEVAGPGTLVHPSLGIMRVSLVAPVRLVERAEKGGMVELQFEFAETRDPTYPGASRDALGAVLGVVDRAIASIGASFVGEIVGAAVLGIGVVTAITTTVTEWGDVARSLARDAGLTTGAVKGLAPADGTYGRYGGGSRRGAATEITTTQGALDAGVTGRAAVDAAAAALTDTAAAGRSGNVARAAFGVSEALRGACADPADAVRLLMRLATYEAGVVPTSAPLGSAIVRVREASAAACRQGALCSLALACADYAPASYEEATALRIKATELIQAEELRIGPAVANSLYQTLTQLRGAVAEDLTARGAVLPRLRTVRTPQARPALVIAYHLYGDAARADELTHRVNPPHPGFMPTEFQALTS